MMIIAPGNNILVSEVPTRFQNRYLEVKNNQNYFFYLILFKIL